VPYGEWTDLRSEGLLLRGRLIAGAWSPALVLLGVRLSTIGWIYTVIFELLALVAALNLVLLVRARSATNEQPFVITFIEDQGSDVPAYLITIVFPFVFLDLQTWQDTVVWAMFAGLTGLLMVRTDLALTNPALVLAGYRMYRIHTSTGYSGVLLSRTPVRCDDSILAVRLAHGAVKLVQNTTDGEND